MPTDYDDHNHTTTAIDSDIAKLKIAVGDLTARVTALEAGSPPDPPPVPAPLGIYGPAINCDSKSNLQVGWTNRAKVAHRFRASTSSTPVSVRWAQRGGAYPYSGGDGGTYRVTVQGDNGGVPNGTILASGTYGPKVPNGGVFDLTALTGAGAVVKGTIYYLVYENTSASPTSNWLSVNHLFVFGSPLNPRQPKFPDSDMAVLYGGSPWVLQGQFTPVFDLTYTDGSHDGQGYVGMLGINNQAVYASPVSGSKMVRQTMAPTTDRAFTEVAVRLRRTGGNSPLTVSLGGQILGTLAASSVPITASGGDNGGSVWRTISWLGAVTLRAGQASGLYFSAPSDTNYTLAGVRAGTDSGFAASLSFSEGTMQESSDSGATWRDVYSSPMDAQCYVR